MVSRQSSVMRLVRLMAAAALLVTSLLFGAAGAPSAFAANDPGAVYLITNDAAANGVEVFNRAADGTLAELDTFPTGGLGTGANLGSQGSVILSANNRWLFAVDAGSNDIASFEVLPDGLHLVGRFPSGGTLPISLTAHENMLYVLNAGGSGNIAGFWANDGVLSPIAGSIQPLSGAAVGPAQIQFNASGSVLVVTEKATSQIVTYVVDSNGAATAPIAHPSAGTTPFGFDIDRRGHVIVSEAVASAASSYALADDGSLAVVSSSVVNGQHAACWVVISKNGRFAYTANAGSADLSSYSIGQDGSLTLLQGAIPSGAGPLDLGISVSGSFLYALNAAADTISAFRVEADGTLTPLEGTVTVAPTAVGLAAR